MEERDLQLCADALQFASPRRTVEIPRTQGGLVHGGRWPRLTLGRTKTVQYAYLLPDGEGASLRLFPGDTLTQARELYADSARIDAVLRLRNAGWDVRPNFHFGFANRGYAWMTTTTDVERYTNYWLAAIRTARELDDDEWARFLREMESRGFMSGDDRERFAAAFDDTQRKKATPRPGLQMLKQISSELGDAEVLGHAVATELRAALAALRETGVSLR